MAGSGAERQVVVHDPDIECHRAGHEQVQRPGEKGDGVRARADRLRIDSETTRIGRGDSMLFGNRAEVTEAVGALAHLPAGPHVLVDGQPIPIDGVRAELATSLEEWEGLAE